MKASSPADCRKEYRTNDLTRVELTWFEKRIEHWIRFGRIAEETIIDRRRRIVSFAPGAVFAFVRWAANDFGTTVSRVDIARAVAPGEPYSTLPFVRPGAEILLRIDGWPKVNDVLGAGDHCALRRRSHALCRASVYGRGSQVSAGVSPALRVRPACPTAIGPFVVFVTEAAQRFRIPESWIRAVMRVESFGDVRAVSPKGAMGLMQLMPNTYAELRLRHRLGVDPCNPHDNILAGAAYLREMLDRYGAPGFLAAYNAGPARYDEHLIKGRPLPGETQDYVAKLAPMIGEQQGEDQKGAAFDLFARLHAALFPPLADTSPSAVLLAVRAQPDRSPAIRRVVDLSALAPSSDGLFVRLASEAGSR